MHIGTRLVVASVGLVASFSQMAALAQDNAYPNLSPQAFLQGYGGCFGPRCFSYGAALDGDTGLTINTGPSVSVTQRNSSGQWPLRQVLTNPDFVVPNTYPKIERALPFPPFGTPIVLQGDIIFAGGTSKVYNNRDIVYVMKRTSGQWTKHQVLAIPRRAEQPVMTITGLAFDSNMVAVSSMHYREQAGYLESSWPRIDIFVQQPTGLFSRRALIDPIGHSEQRQVDYRIALDGTLLLIGDPYAFDGAGRAYLYELTSKGWSFRKTFAPPSDASPGNFGDAVAVNGSTVAISAPDQTVSDNQTGAIYVYNRTGSEWPLWQAVIAPEYFADDSDQASDGWQFGRTFALAGDRLVSTVNYYDWRSPLAYLFERRGSTWAAVATFKSPDGLPYPGGAYLSGSRLLLGAADDAYSQASYVFELPEVGSAH
jgi:hypothetical protein